jgi:TfoX/Sxy family transcriptional regulator of competence genes
MAFDEVLAARVRDVVARLAPVEEKRMFGGIAYMVNTHMACGLIGDDLMVRVGEDDYEPALDRGATEMTHFSGRPMRGMVIVPGPVLVDDAELADWVGSAVAWAQAQPPKAPKTPKPARRT